MSSGVSFIPRFMIYNQITDVPGPAAENCALGSNDQQFCAFPKESTTDGRFVFISMRRSEAKLRVAYQINA
jgi:hypothetical protein